MPKFETVKHGYDTEQVQKYINTLCLKYEEKLTEQKDRVFSLKNEVAMLQERLDAYQKKDKQISKALIYAVEKAEQIENSASNLYNLEIKRIRLLYDKWYNLLMELERNFPNILTNGMLAYNLTEFKGNIEKIIEQNIKLEGGVKDKLKQNSSGYIKNLLNRMDYVINENSIPNEDVKDMATTIKKQNSMEREMDRIQSIKLRLKNINGKFSVEKDENIVDKFLNSNDVKLKDNVFTKNLMPKNYIIPNESGFDLEEALNPKEDLEEIMKAFDFFTSDDNE